MALKLMYITCQPDIAQIAERSGVDRIFLDMEYIGKSFRQGGMDTVQCRHTYEDIKSVRRVISKSELLVRVNPIHSATSEYCSSEEEIEMVVECGADIIMLPYFKTMEEVEEFISIVNGRAKTMLLVETPEAVNNIDSILAVDGIDEIHIGLNDLSLGYKRRFMFELLADKTVENLCRKISESGIAYGFGGIAALGKGLLPAERVIMEHYRLGSGIAILSRSFCNTHNGFEPETVRRTFTDGISEIRKYEDYCENHPELWEENRRKAAEIILDIAAKL